MGTTSVHMHNNSLIFLDPSESIRKDGLHRDIASTYVRKRGLFWRPEWAICWLGAGQAGDIDSIDDCFPPLQEGDEFI